MVSSLTLTKAAFLLVKTSPEWSKIQILQQAWGFYWLISMRNIAFNFITEKVKKKNEGWRDKTLSTCSGKGGYVEGYSSIYSHLLMRCFELPKTLCHECQKLMARFFWGALEEDM